MQLLGTEIFRQCGNTALQKNYSLLAIRYSLSFRLGRSLALPFFFRPTPRVPRPVKMGEGTQVGCEGLNLFRLE
ncbi:MAG: hypothetical protein EORIYHIE_000545 [Candidatus Fervidibacter sp.]|jgi:hypothetical protein